MTVLQCLQGHPVPFFIARTIDEVEKIEFIAEGMGR